MEQLRRENKAFAQELKDVTDQLGDGGKNVHELQKARRRLECELQEAQVRMMMTTLHLRGMVIRKRIPAFVIFHSR